LKSRIFIFKINVTSVYKNLKESLKILIIYQSITKRDDANQTLRFWIKFELFFTSR